MLVSLSLIVQLTLGLRRRAVVSGNQVAVGLVFIFAYTKRDAAHRRAPWRTAHREPEHPRCDRNGIGASRQLAACFGGGRACRRCCRPASQNRNRVAHEQHIRDVLWRLSGVSQPRWLRCVLSVRGLQCVLSEAPLGTDVFVRLPKLVSVLDTICSRYPQRAEVSCVGHQPRRHRGLGFPGPSFL